MKYPSKSPCPECGKAHGWALPKSRYSRLDRQPHGNWTTSDVTDEVDSLRRAVAELSGENIMLTRRLREALGISKDEVFTIGEP